MNCVFCAEVIQDEAALCRFCGARKTSGTWTAAAHPGPVLRKSNFTMVSSGWLLLLSAVWSVFTLGDPVPLLGAARTGPVAWVYNALLGAGFACMGYALARRTPWALKATAWASAAYTLDKLNFILDAQARQAVLGASAQALQALGPLGGAVERMAVTVSVGFLAGWWGLALLVFMQGSYFAPEPPASPQTGPR